MTTPEIDPKICPLCGKPNHCAYQAGRPHTDCWCVTTSVPKELLQQIPADKRRKACVCQACVNEFNEQKMTH